MTFRGRWWRDFAGAAAALLTEEDGGTTLVVDDPTAFGADAWHATSVTRPASARLQAAPRRSVRSRTGRE
jgi:hypothetical protein